MAGKKGRTGTNRKRKAMRLPALRSVVSASVPADAKTDSAESAAAEAPTPEFLSDGAREVWDQVARMFDRRGISTAIDDHAIAMYCEQYAIWREAQRQVKEQGAVVKNEYLTLPNPALKVMNDASDRMLKMLLQFGASPSAAKKKDGAAGDAVEKGKARFALIQGIKGRGAA